MQTEPSGDEGSKQESKESSSSVSVSKQSPENTTSTDESIVVGIKYSVKGTKNYLALRNAPAYDASNEIAKLQNGDEVLIKSQSVYGDKYEYCYVAVVSGSALGKEGYVNKNYLPQGASNPSINTGDTKPKTSGTYTVYTVTGTTNFLGVRTAPVYDGSNVIYKLNNGDQIYVYSTETFGDKGEYWYIKVPGSGTEGYVNKNYLTPSSSTSSKSEETFSKKTTNESTEKTDNILNESDYSSLIEGELTKSQLELVLSRVSNDIVQNGMSDSESMDMALYFVNALINDSNDRGLSYYGIEQHWAKISKKDMNRLFSAFSNYTIDSNGFYSYNDDSKRTYADDNTLYVALASTSDEANAEIYQTELDGDELRISYHYSYRRSGSADVNEDRTAIFHKASDGMFKIDSIQ